jgi:ribosomal 50S subunit-recycling heat shock protein
MKEIQLTQGKVALVDDEDYEYLNQWKWHIHNSRGYYYAARNINGGKLFMHRAIIKPTKDVFIDHVNRLTLDNTKINLRICTKAENCRNRKISTLNTSGYKGVAYIKNLNKYRATIRFNNKQMHLGYYIIPIDAARAYNEAAIKFHGEFANLNKIEI